MRLLATTLFLNLSGPIQADATDEAGWNAAHLESICSEEGKLYEMTAVSTFWGNASFMSVCAPEDVDVPQNIEIYFSVGEDGGIRNIATFPSTDVAKCIIQNTKDRMFPNAPKNYVVHIELTFQ